MLMANQTFFLIQKSNVKTLSNFSLFNIILIPNGDFQKSRRKFLHNTKKMCIEASACAESQKSFLQTLIRIIVISDLHSN